MKFIKRAKRANLILSDLLLIPGGMMLLGYTFSPATLCLLSGILLLILGIAKLCGYFSRDPFRLAFQFDYAFGLLSLIAGCLLLIFSETLTTFLLPFWGLYTLFDGVLKMQTARDAKLFGLEYWWMIILLGALTCITGILVLAESDSQNSSQRLLGLALLITGIQNVSVIAYTVRTPKKKAPHVFPHNDIKAPKGIYEKNQ